MGRAFTPSVRTKKLASSDADARYMLPEGANLVVSDGDEIDAGDVIVTRSNDPTLPVTAADRSGGRAPRNTNV